MEWKAAEGGAATTNLLVVDLLLLLLLSSKGCGCLGGLGCASSFRLRSGALSSARLLLAVLVARFPLLRVGRGGSGSGDGLSGRHLVGHLKQSHSLNSYKK